MSRTAIIAALLLGSSAAAQPQTGEPPAAPAAPAATAEDVRTQTPDWKAIEERLLLVSPADPEGYLLLAEELAEFRDDARARRTAIELAVRAVVFDSRRGDRSRVGASACVLIAHLTSARKDRSMVMSLARRLDPRFAGPEWLSFKPPAAAEENTYQLATLLGLIRSGEGVRARQVFARDEVKASLQALDKLLRVMDVGTSVASLQRDAQRWPCPDCGNTRITRRPGVSPPDVRACPNCQADPGPLISEAELVAQLRLESYLLQGSQRSWAAQLATERGATLIEPTPESIAAAFRIDPWRCVWRDGDWREDPAFPRPARKPTTPPQAPNDEAGSAPAHSPGAVHIKP